MEGPAFIQFNQDSLAIVICEFFLDFLRRLFGVFRRFIRSVFYIIFDVFCFF